MAGIEEVLERLVADPAFRAALARDPGAALLPYDLTADDVALLASRLDDRDDAQRAVEQRTSKSALFAALGMLAGGGDGGAPDSVVGHDETLTIGGDRTEAVGVESTQVPAPPAPPVPVPYPNTAEAEVTMESLELSAEGVELDHAGHEVTHVQQQDDNAGAAAVGHIKYGDITLKRGVVDEPVPGPDDLLGADDGGSEAGGFLKLGDIKGEAADHPETAEDPARVDDVLEIDDA